MCCIVALVGSQDAAPLLRAEGKLVNLAARYEEAGAAGLCGIGHSPWATHGKPEERNATRTWMARAVD